MKGKRGEGVCGEGGAVGCCGMKNAHGREKGR